MLYVCNAWDDASGRTRVACDELVSTGANWKTPARILGLEIAEFILHLKNSGASFSVYRKEDKVTCIGYYWNNRAKALEYKNLLNAKAREVNYKI